MLQLQHNLFTKDLNFQDTKFDSLIDSISINNNTGSAQLRCFRDYITILNRTDSTISKRRIL